MDENLRLNLSRPVPWLTSFSIDQGMLDEDHRRLIDMCNELCTAASFDVGRSERLLTDWGALELMNAHFTNEEWVLAEIEYPEAAGHKREHDRVRGSIVALSRAARERNFAQDLNGVRTELVEHIIRHDLGFKSHLLHRDGR